MKIAYTFKKLNAELFELYSSVDGEVIPVPVGHPKFKWMQSLAKDRIINISIKGAWNSSRDYNGLLSAKPKSAKPLKIKLTQLNDLEINDALFIPMKTGTAMDKWLSTDGGFMPGSNVMAAGAPGVGKTTVLLEMLHRVRLQDPKRKVLFISAEMTQLDMARYLKRFPQWGTLPILFLSDYAEEDPKAVIESTLNQGWDLVLTDSYSEVNDTVKEACSLTRGKTEAWFLNLMTKQNKGENRLKLYTTFVTILQLSKGGQFVGSNKLKHLTTSMMDLNWKGGENSSERYMEFTKNRLGQVGQKLYFDMADGVQFDSGRYQRDLLNTEMILEEKEKLEKEGHAFDQLFARLPNEMDAGPAEVEGLV